MDTPSILPLDLRDIARYQTDQELFDALLRQTERLVRFFSYAADDGRGPQTTFYFISWRFNGSHIVIWMID